MASNYFVQQTADGKKTFTKRSAKQGRRPSGLAKPRLVRLYEVDEQKLTKISERLGYLFNANEIIRLAVHNQINSVYTELVNT